MHWRDCDGVQVSAVCPNCASVIVAPYSQIVEIRRFVCGCGATVGADMVKVSAAAMLGLLEEAA
jgi:ribosomal protein S27AE